MSESLNISSGSFSSSQASSMSRNCRYTLYNLLKDRNYGDTIEFLYISGIFSESTVHVCDFVVIR